MAKVWQLLEGEKRLMQPGECVHGAQGFAFVSQVSFGPIEQSDFAAQQTSPLSKAAY